MPFLIMVRMNGSEYADPSWPMPVYQERPVSICWHQVIGWLVPWWPISPPELYDDSSAETIVRTF